ncbi:hypothetical protein VTO73DRAFT_267 [Trametes versicolor]
MLCLWQFKRLESAASSETFGSKYAAAAATFHDLPPVRGTTASGLSHAQRRLRATAAGQGSTDISHHPAYAPSSGTESDECGPPAIPTLLGARDQTFREDNSRDDRVPGPLTDADTGAILTLYQPERWLRRGIKDVARHPQHPNSSPT